MKKILQACYVGLFLNRICKNILNSMNVLLYFRCCILNVSTIIGYVFTKKQLFFVRHKPDSTMALSPGLGYDLTEFLDKKKFKLYSFWLISVSKALILKSAGFIIK